MLLLLLLLLLLGGACHFSGAHTTAYFHSCTFSNNHIRKGSGGGLSVERSASIRMNNIQAYNNTATLNGGFLHAYLSSPTLLQSVTISNNKALSKGENNDNDDNYDGNSGSHSEGGGGGGGLAIIASKIALEDVRITSCSTGTGGGGGILLEGQAEAHLIASILHNNQALYGGLGKRVKDFFRHVYNTNRTSAYFFTFSFSLFHFFTFSL
jgi:hypothetical protein